MMFTSFSSSLSRGRTAAGASLCEAGVDARRIWSTNRVWTGNSISLAGDAELADGVGRACDGVGGVGGVGGVSASLSATCGSGMPKWRMTVWNLEATKELLASARVGSWCRSKVATVTIRKSEHRTTSTHETPSQAKQMQEQSRASLQHLHDGGFVDGRKAPGFGQLLLQVSLAVHDAHLSSSTLHQLRLPSGTDSESERIRAELHVESTKPPLG